MTSQEHLTYDRIADAIAYIKANFKSRPSLEEIADQVHISPFHFQRQFTEWAGVSPKKFMNYLSIEYAKQRLNGQASLFDTAFETGLSGTGRLHDLFVNIEGMTPGEYKNGGKNLRINYSLTESPFGTIVVASTPKGVCYMAFADEVEGGLYQLKIKFPNAGFSNERDKFQQEAISIFQHDWSQLSQIKLHLKGTPFQLKVWEALLKIPFGKMTTYGNISQNINQPNASRAVGTAIGNNPVAFLIPCHRVIRNSGELGGYRWGATRKSAIIGWEAAKTENAYID